jgi:adenylyl-sulfate kinase
MQKGRVFWFFGLSGSGKTTLSVALAPRLRSRGHGVLWLDGDELRSGLCRDLGFTDAARTENIRRAAEIAALASRQGQIVLAAFITPREDLRQLAREIVGRDYLELIWVDAPLHVCRQRDPKGLYRKSDTGGLLLLTGVHSAFEPPAEFDLRLDSSARDVRELHQELEDYCVERLKVGPR